MFILDEQITAAAEVKFLAGQPQFPIKINQEPQRKISLLSRKTTIYDNAPGNM